MPHDFDTVIDRRETLSTKWEKYAGRDVIPMFIADMDFRSPPAVIDALRRRVEHGVFGYPRRPKELPECVVRLLEADYGWKVDPGWIVWMPSVTTGFNAACRIAGEAGDDVAASVPLYGPLLEAPSLSGRNLVKVPMQRADGRWQFDWELFERTLTPRTRMFLHCNPHNPTGRALSRPELEALAGICLRRDVLICSDEIHCGLVLDRDKRHVPLASLSPEVADRTITLMSPCKTFNIPGVTVAFAVVPNATLRERLGRVMAGIVPHMSVLGYVAALAGYRDGRDWQNELLEYLRGNRDLLEAEVATMPGLQMTHMEATYLAWIDTRELNLPRPAKFFEQAGVGLSDGWGFGLEGFVRLNFACPRSVLREAIGRIRRAVAR